VTGVSNAVEDAYYRNVSELEIDQDDRGSEDRAE
jgi:hypothetical protein